jgi:uncharacterized protein YkwD
VAALLVPFCAWPQGTVSSAERDLFALINRDRQAQGLRPLRWDDNLTTAARQHSQEMARHGALSHQFPGEPSLSTRARQSGVHYAWLSENVDQGHDSRSLNDQWMNSPPHRGNILDKDMDSVGVGVVESRGLLWATADFSQAK